ncbi:winged helix-turn-helix domain-containing protein [Streptomyces sp. NBC_01390]|uniref:winged helix-turn-helix domain-containing protein n=1 Tax=Streptomyces sp. NBC_01390 TaxID=2903850 RepID=UPI0032568D41
MLLVGLRAQLRRRCTLHDQDGRRAASREFDLLAVLARHAGETVSRETLMAEGGGTDTA